MVELIWWLVCAHFLGDFVLQSRWVAENKGSKWYVLLAHSITWAAPITVVLFLFGYFSIPVAVFLVVTHYIIDDWKCMLPMEWKYIYLDQIMHFVSIGLVLVQSIYLS